jgi:hypothetical protein
MHPAASTTRLKDPVHYTGPSSWRTITMVVRATLLSHQTCTLANNNHSASIGTSGHKTVQYLSSHATLRRIHGTLYHKHNTRDQEELPHTSAMHSVYMTANCHKYSSAITWTSFAYVFLGPGNAGYGRLYDRNKQSMCMWAETIESYEYNARHVRYVNGCD